MYSTVMAVIMIKYKVILIMLMFTPPPYLF